MEDTVDAVFQRSIHMVIRDCWAGAGLTVVAWQVCNRMNDLDKLVNEGRPSRRRAAELASLLVPHPNNEDTQVKTSLFDALLYQHASRTESNMCCKACVRIVLSWGVALNVSFVCEGNRALLYFSPWGSIPQYPRRYDAACVKMLLDAGAAPFAAARRCLDGSWCMEARSFAVLIAKFGLDPVHTLQCWRRWHGRRSRRLWAVAGLTVT
jgi:hypothetical protein